MDTFIPPKYYQLRKRFSEMIESGRLRPGDKLPAERVLAQQYGMSRLTVRQGLDKLVHEGRLVRQQGSGTFVAQPSKEKTGIAAQPESLWRRILRGEDISTPRDTRGVIGIIGRQNVFPETSADEGFYARVIDTLSGSIESDGYTLNLAIGDDTFSSLNTFNQQGLSAVFIIGDVHPDCMNYVRRLNIPGVAINTDLEGMPCVVPDNTGGIRLLLKHLTSLGHRRIVLIAGPEGNYSTIRRTQAFENWREAQGLKAEEAPILRGANAFGLWAAYQVCREHIQVLKKVTAVIASADLMACGVIRALREINLKVPQEVSVAGIDNMEWTMENDPPLTTIDVDRAGMARFAFQLMQQMLEGRTDSSETFIRPVSLCIRSSTRERR